jgi:aminoglycoside phosphotransferase family enzyme/predicted kinase
VDQAALIDALHRPEAWPEGERPTEVRATHASVVFLTERRAYKVKKAIDLGFLDYSTLAARRHWCEEEVRLNRPRAPGIYLGVVPIALAAGRPRVEAAGEAVEWAVKMARLPDEASLLARLEANDVTPELLARIGRKLGELHREAERSSRIAQFGSADVARRNTVENFEQSRPEIGRCVSEAVFSRLQALQLGALDALGPAMDRRVAAGRPCDTHGDLRLEHVYVLPAGIAFIDCIEFNERFRYADPIADLAFLYMDLAVRGARELAEALGEAWFSASGDDDARALLPFWSSYRSTVRGKVAGMILREPDLPPDRAQDALDRARRHWLFALGELAPPSERPCLVGIGGLPGTGKSTLAAGLAREAHFEVVRSDVVRKELAHLPQSFHPQGEQKDKLYADDFKDRVYRECFDRAARLLLEGERVVVDASFWKERWRLELLDRARSLGVPAVLLRCEASVDEVRARLARRRSDASDADFHVYEQAVAEWESEGTRTSAATHALASDATAVDVAIGYLNRSLAIFGTGG